MNQLGFAPAVIMAAKFVPAIIGIFGNSKKKEAAEQAMRQQQLQESQAAIAAGVAVDARQVLPERDKQILATFWPQIHVAANFSDINWGRLGYPGGPPLSPTGVAVATYAWPQVHDAARFSDINWDYHAIPVEGVAPTMPLPELGYQQFLPDMSGSPGGRQFLTSGQGYQTASLIPGISSDTVITAAVIGVAALLLFGDRR